MKPIKVLLAIAATVLLVLTSRAQNCDPPPSGLVAWWQAEGNALDSVGTNNGSWNGTSGYTNGEVGQAFNFNGANYVLVPDASALRFTNAMTVEAWVYLNTFSGTGSSEIVSKFGGPNTGQAAYTFSVQQSTQEPYFIVNAFNGGSSDTILSSIPITTHQWFHLAGVYDGSAIKIYVNGQLEGTSPWTQGIFPGNNPLVIGCTLQNGSVPTSFFNGQIDEVSLYNRALSSNEIAAIYEAGSQGKCTMPVPPSIISQPTNETVNVGDTASFSVTAGGTAPLSYQWSFGTTNIAGATNTTLTLTNVQLTQAGNYSVLVTNIAGSTNSVTATLTVNAPGCDPPPSGLVAWWRGENNTLDSVGTNNGSFLGSASYTNGEVGNAMLFNGVNNGVVVPASASLNVGTGNGLTIEAWVNPSEITPGGKANPVVEWNEGNGSGYGSAFWLTHPSVAIGNFFANLVDTSGGNHVIFSNSGLITTNIYQHVAVTYDKASGTAALYYNGVQVAVDTTFGAFTPQTTYPLYLGERPPGDINSWVFSGSMDEISIYNRALSSNEIAAIYLAGSEGKCVTAVPPFITIQPTNVTVNVGDTASFNVSASGTAPLSYQWSFNTTNILNATNVTLTLTNVQLNQAGNYSVLVTNIAGSTNSIVATLTVLAVPPSITAQPTNQTVQAGGTASFTVTAAGTPPLAYQWSFGTTNIAGATNATLTLTNVQLTQAGNYSVLVTNIAGSTNSSNATLSVVTTLDHFAWDTIPSPQGANQPFGVTITAKNVFGVTVTNFAGAVSLQASSAGALTNSALVLNGDFETGTLTNWTQVTISYGKFVTNNGTVIPPGASGAVAPYAGSYSALGDESGPGVFYMYQDISIPPGVSTATLSWAHCVRNYYSSFNSAQGFQVRICDTNNNILATAFTTSPGGTLLGNWVQTNYDVTAFAGTTVRVMFWVDSTYSYIDAYVDSVSVQLAANIPITPANSGSFVNGVWSGNITVPQPATNVVLAANDGSGHAGSSNPFNVVLSPPVITTQPTNQTVFVGQAASFSVTASGTAPFGYQWSFGTTNIGWATNTTLTLTNVQLNQAGNYSVLVTNIAGSTNSTSAVLTILLPPTITTAVTGENVQLTWPVSSGTFQLQSADNVLGPWTIVPPLTIATNGANVTVTVEATNQQQYFRLIGQ